MLGASRARASSRQGGSCSGRERRQSPGKAGPAQAGAGILGHYCSVQPPNRLDYCPPRRSRSWVLRSIGSFAASPGATSNRESVEKSTEDLQTVEECKISESLAIDCDGLYATDVNNTPCHIVVHAKLSPGLRNLHAYLCEAKEERPIFIQYSGHCLLHDRAEVSSAIAREAPGRNNQRVCPENPKPTQGRVRKAKGER